MQNAGRLKVGMVPQVTKFNTTSRWTKRSFTPDAVRCTALRCGVSRNIAAKKTQNVAQRRAAPQRDAPGVNKL